MWKIDSVTDAQRIRDLDLRVTIDVTLTNEHGDEKFDTVEIGFPRGQYEFNSTLASIESDEKILVSTQARDQSRFGAGWETLAAHIFFDTKTGECASHGVEFGY